MSDLDLLKEKEPAIAEFVADWRNKFARTYDLSDTSEKANFYEGLSEMAKHIASLSDGASIAVDVSVDGVSGVRISASRG